MNVSSVLQFVGLLVVIGAGALLVQYVEEQGVSPIEVRDFIASFGMWSAIVFLMFNALCGILFVPGLVTLAIGAVLFGAGAGFILNLFGTMLAAIAGFALARLLGKRFVQDLLGRRLEPLQTRITGNGRRVMFWLRLVPVVPFFGLNCVAGVSRISFMDYVEGSFLGMIPPVFMYTYLFAAIGESVLTDGFSLALLASPHVVVPVVVLALLVVLPVVFRKRLARFERKLER